MARLTGHSPPCPPPGRAGSLAASIYEICSRLIKRNRPTAHAAPAAARPHYLAPPAQDAPESYLITAVTSMLAYDPHGTL